MTDPVTTVAADLSAILTRAHSLLSEIYEPAGVLIFWSSRNAHLDGRRPADLVRDRDLFALERMCDRIDATCDGNF